MVTSLQVVIGDLRVEVVNVMVSDVAREPLEHPWKVVVAAPLHGSGGVIPFIAAGPVGVFELMLNVKQPQAEEGSDGHHGQLNHQPRQEAVNHAHPDAPSHQRGVHDVDRPLLASLGFGVGEALQDDEKNERSEHEQDDGVADEPIAQLQLSGRCDVLFDGQRPDIADASPVEITVGGVMACMLPTPLTVRGEGEHPGDEAYRSVRTLGFEEGTVTAIMEDDERSNEKQSTQQGRWNGEPKRDVLQKVDADPNGCNGDQGVHDLPNGATDVRLLVLCDQFFPFFCGGTLRCLCTFCEVFSHLHHQRRGVLIVGQGVEPKKVVFYSTPNVRI